jgi:hypothetical protein
MVSSVSDVSEFGYYAGGARFEYGERHGRERLATVCGMPWKMLETGGEIRGKSWTAKFE